MHTATKIFWTMVLTIAAGITVFAAAGPQTINLPEGPGNYVLDDEDDPDVTDRVARISYISGEAKIRRAGMQDWERVTLNLPLVEGDEIVSDVGSHLEIQFSKDQHLRLADSAYLKIATLRDSGIAVGLELGTMTLRLRSFDKDKSFFEIDAPKTTVAIQQDGSYRVEAGHDTDTDVRVTAFEGEARVYSDNSGFTLKQGRSSRIFIDGQNAGEWEIADAAKFGDEFDDWCAVREAVIAKQLSTAFYNTYYDSDIYGADDLNGNGDWVHLAAYGWVWRPWLAATAAYPDWSPYRYGQWRWVPPYGWSWVNDEPWAYATYHHGRWFYNSGSWYWSPYSYNRPQRSWWFPALVVFNTWGNNTCWYPMGWRRNWRNDRWDYAVRRIRPNTGTVAAVTPRDPLGTKDLSGRKENSGEFEDNVPPGGIVAIDKTKFGTGAKPVRPALDVAKSIIARRNVPDRTTLPDYKDVSSRITREIKVEKPKIVDDTKIARSGATVRKSANPLDNDLKTKTIYGGRTPKPELITPVGKPTDERKTGVFERPPVEVKERPSTRETPRYIPPPVTDSPPAKETPRYVAPPVRETPKYSPPAVVKETPRYTPPVVRTVERPKAEAPKEKPPAKVEAKPAPRKDDGAKGERIKPVQP